jgi:hypothetical protein
MVFGKRKRETAALLTQMSLTNIQLDKIIFLMMSGCYELYK